MMYENHRIHKIRAKREPLSEQFDHYNPMNAAVWQRNDIDNHEFYILKRK